MHFSEISDVIMRFSDSRVTAGSSNKASLVEYALHSNTCSKYIH